MYFLAPQRNNAFCVADDSDVPETQHLHVHSSCLVERNWFLAHLWSPYAENVEVSARRENVIP
jgi:hypothetical protein